MPKQPHEKSLDYLVGDIVERNKEWNRRHAARLVVNNARPLSKTPVLDRLEETIGHEEKPLRKRN